MSLKSTPQSALKDKTARTWDLTTRKPIHVLKGHNNLIEGCAISPDGKLLVTTGHDNLVKVWDAGRKELVRTLKGFLGPDDSISAFNGMVVITATDEGQKRVGEILDQFKAREEARRKNAVPTGTPR